MPPARRAAAAEPAEPEQPVVAAPGPAGRIQRSAGQAGAVTILIELWVAFGWFGADHWDEQQNRAVMAVGILLAAIIQNVAGHLHGRTEVAPVEQAPPPPEG